jgi:small subunit ribosomal protein S4
MARYTGPKSKISRRFGVALFGPDKALERRNYPPGQHGPRGYGKKSEYAQALAEKLKLRYMYGILEKQFRRYYHTAQAKTGVTGDVLLQLLETRLDNIVFRLGFCNSRDQARQTVNHGHMLVNGKKVTIPSYQCKQGDVIEVRNNPKSRRIATTNLEGYQNNTVPEWMSLDKEQFRGTVSRIPTRDEIAPIANERLVVELYSR